MVLKGFHSKSDEVGAAYRWMGSAALWGGVLCVAAAGLATFWHPRGRHALRCAGAFVQAVLAERRRRAHPGRRPSGAC